MTEEERTILLTRHDGHIQRHEGRIKELERRQDDLEKLASSVASLAQRQADMDGDLKEIKKDVRLLAEKPGKRWDNVIEKMLSVMVGAVVGYVMVRLGFG